MSKLLFLTIAIIACASMSFAQSTDYNKVEFFGGFSHNRVDTGFEDSDFELGDIINEREGFNGFNASVTGNVTRYIGLKLDVAGHFKKQNFPLGIGNASVDLDASIFNVLGGVQLKDNSNEGRFKPFAHALVGAARFKTTVDFSNDFCAAIFPSPCPVGFSESETGLAGAFGGGLDIRVSDRVDIRAFQLDYNPTRIDGSTLHNVRVGVGIVIH
jgi:opacity protein-like surface antigen